MSAASNMLFLSFCTAEVIASAALLFYFFKISVPVPGTTEWIDMAQKERAHISSLYYKITAKDILFTAVTAIVSGVVKFFMLSFDKAGGVITFEIDRTVSNGAYFSALVFAVISALVFLFAKHICKKTFSAAAASLSFILCYCVSFPGVSLDSVLQNDIITLYGAFFMVSLFFIYKAATVSAERSRLFALLLIMLGAVFAGSLMIGTAGKIIILGFILLLIFHLYDLSRTYLEAKRPFPFALYIFAVFAFLIVFSLLMPAVIEFALDDGLSGLDFIPAVLGTIKTNITGFFDGFKINGPQIFLQYKQISSVFCLCCIIMGISASSYGIIKRKDSFLIFPFVLIVFSLLSLVFTGNYIIVSCIVPALCAVFLSYIFDVIYERGERSINVFLTALIIIASFLPSVFHLI